MPKIKRVGWIAAILLVGFVAWSMRLRAVEKLPIDYDEDDYLGAAQRYAQLLVARDVDGIVNYAYNYEHPPLTKLLYGAVIAPLPAAPLLPERPATDPPRSFMPQPHFQHARLLSAAFGTLEPVALAALNPLAGLLLAINTWTIKYTSQIMLEPLPALTSLLAVLFYTRSKRRFDGWLVFSALMLGLTAASKYTYCVVGLAIAADWVWRDFPRDSDVTRRRWTAWLGPVVLWGGLAILVFFVANPRLWTDPLGRLTQSIFYHAEYAQGAQVRRAGLPTWQPLIWLLQSVPWHPGVFVLPLDFFVTVLAGFGLRSVWRTQRVFALWLVIAFVFLLLWPTKWPQYVLILTAPLSLAAAEGFRSFVWSPLRKRWRAEKIG